MRMPLVGLPRYLGGGGVQGDNKAQNVIAFVFKVMRLTTLRQQRQRRMPVHAVQHLNGRLVADAEQDGMPGRAQIQANDVGGLGLEIQAVRDHVGIRSMGPPPCWQ